MLAEINNQGSLALTPVTTKVSRNEANKRGSDLFCFLYGLNVELETQLQTLIFHCVDCTQ
jgi:hypothetical protein